MADIAAERGTAPFDTLLDIVLADDLRTVLWPNTDDGEEATWGMRAEIWSDPRAMVGGSDAGAHLDRMCGSSYPTAFLADCLRGRKLVSVEKAVHMLTASPPHCSACASGGWSARASPPTCSSSTPRRSLQAGAARPRPARRHPRLYAGSHGVVRVLVNGVETVRDGAPTGALPGARSSVRARHRLGCVPVPA